MRCFSRRLEEELCCANSSRESKNLIKSYRPVSLLPIFSKVFERLIFNALFNFFLQNKLFTPCQSGFIPGDSCVSQLLSVTHEIYKSFNCHPPTDIRGTFRDISKAFDKVWHECLIIKLKSYGIDGKLLKLLKNYLTDRQQRVVLNDQTSSGQNIYAGVPQGSVLRPPLFLIYVNELPDGLTSMCKIFADDTSLFSKVNDKSNSNSQLNSDIAKISKWAFQWKMSFNPDPNNQTIEVCFSNKRDKGNYPPLHFNSTNVQVADSQKHLGLVLDSKLNFNEHIESRISKCNKIIGLMKKLSQILSRKSLLTIYKSFVKPNLDYTNIIYDKPLSKSFKKKIEMVQYNAALIITDAIKRTCRDKIYQELDLKSLADRTWSRKLIFFYKIVLGFQSSYLQNYLSPYDNVRTYLNRYSTQKINKNL